MAGNVWEWTSSLSQRYPYQAGDGREDPAADGSRVLRGGSYGGGLFWIRAAHRYYFGLYVTYDVGFRCARSGSEP